MGAAGIVIEEETEIAIIRMLIKSISNKLLVVVDHPHLKQNGRAHVDGAANTK